MSVPAHHSRQEECLTRPPYRQGRKTTAVKVYTVAQESQWLLIQGVPHVGAQQELAKLFAQYGDIEQCRLLADYPTDNFCETYLIKFKKIQSARYAKKKLDDWSFFGGVLHVCYAPEYESVQETREKLQDRRKVIAAKTRQYAKDGTHSSTPIHTQPHTLGVSHGQDSIGLIHTLPHTLGVSHGQDSIGLIHIQSHTLGVSLGQESIGREQLPLETYSAPVVSAHSYNIESQSSDKKDIVSNRNYEALCNKMDSAVYQPEQFLKSHQRKQNGEQIEESKNFMTETDLEDGSQMWIPLPPKVDPHAEVKTHSWKHYEYAWVPTANAQFPNDFDARLAPDSISNAFIGLEKDSNEIRQEQTTIEKPDLKLEAEKVCGTNVKEKGQVLIKDYRKPGQPPRFIPRQAQMVNKKTGKDKEILDQKKEEDNMTKEIKKNAFILGAQQGPVAPDPTEIEREEKKEKEQERLMNELSSIIRKRVTQFSDIHLPKKITKSTATT
ncbi:hypothetical protein CHS0354_014442 [Potamilus streckersoni]|uniref:RNA-binding protein 48 n=1 Tax=Potamilus streckersoni TaxID=2493646 RepID=A0AAE0VRH2_9BIVA|nr:hypothetical protein CHS0354_014442 [Potamilus streckersoni]